MSNDEIEDRLRAYEARDPRDDLRDDVLGAVRGALAPDSSPLDRLLARRTTWAAAAALLVAVFAANHVVEQAAASRRAERSATLGLDARAVATYRAWLFRRFAGDSR